MAALTREILGPAAAALASGGIYYCAAQGLARGSGQYPKWVLAVPGFGVVASLASAWGGDGWSPMANAAYCSSFAAVGWFGAKMFYRTGG